MDIRNFFSPKKSTKVRTKPKPNENSDDTNDVKSSSIKPANELSSSKTTKAAKNVKSTSKKTSSTSKQKSATTDSTNVPTPNLKTSSRRRSSRLKRIVIDTSSDEELENIPAKIESTSAPTKTTRTARKTRSSQVDKNTNEIRKKEEEKEKENVEDVNESCKESSKTTTNLKTKGITKPNNNQRKKKARTEISADDFFSNRDHKKRKVSINKKPISIKDGDDDDDDDDDDETASNHNDNDSDTDDFVPNGNHSDGVDDDEDLLMDISEEDLALSKAKSNKNPTKHLRSMSSSPSKHSIPNNDDEEMDTNIISKKRSPSSTHKPPSKKMKKTPETSKNETSSPKSSTPTRQKRSTATRKIIPKREKKQKVLVKPTPPHPQPFTTEDVTPSSCLVDVTFVFTGMFPNLSREEMEDFVKILGGRVTSAVSGKTNYLICGSELEDGRQVNEGSKYKRAMGLGPTSITVLHGEDEFFGVIKLISEINGGRVKRPNENIDDKSDDNNNDNDAKKSEEIDADSTNEKNDSNMKTNTVKPDAKKSVVNPYTKKSVVNPYAKKSVVNPYAKGKSSSTNSSNTINSKSNSGERAQVNDQSALWADKYAPSSSRNILGNGENVRKLITWLNKWEMTFINPQKGSGRGHGGPPLRAALLSGPPGIGKTTTAVLVGKESGREVLEWNASDVRSKKGMEASLGDVTGSQVLGFGQANNHNSSQKKRCIIMDEVDGMGAGDRSGMSELIKVIKTSKVPIICICNDRQSQKVRSLVPYCLDLRYRRPVKSVIARRAVEIGRLENMNIEINAAEAIAESCGNDIRQVLNCIQMWSNINSDKKRDEIVSMTYKDLKEKQDSIKKDEMLRVSIFDSTKMIVEGPKGLGHDDVPITVANKSLFDRCDAYFTDYNLMGLNVHQNYLKVMISQFQETKRSDEIDAEASVLDRMQKATLSMSDYAVSEHRVRSGDQLWQLLPLCSVLTVKAGYHASGKNGSFLPGYPEFASWLGKNSTKGKKFRILQELQHHMNYNISADCTSLRLNYLPIIKQRFLDLMMDSDGSKVDEVIELMDEYGLDRDDLFENIDEFTLDSKAFKFTSLDSKSKAAFTRAYNKLAHKSQALVVEQSGGKSSKKKQSNNNDEFEAKELDAVDDDKFEESDSGDDNDDGDIEEIQKMFKKKGRAKATKATKATKAKVGGKKRKK